MADDTKDAQEHHQAMQERAQEELEALRVASTYGVPEPVLMTLACGLGLASELYKEIRHEQK